MTAVDNRLYNYGKWKVELGLNSLTKMKQWRNFTHDSLLATEKVVGHIHFTTYSEEIFISHFLLDYISAIIT